MRRVPSIFATGFLVAAWIGWWLALPSLAHAAENKPREDEEKPAAAASPVAGRVEGEGPSLKSDDQAQRPFKESNPRKAKPERGADPASLIKRLLGVDCRSATFPDLNRYRLSVPGAVVIVFAYPHGPLAAAGFEADDMIMEVEGRPIEGLQGFAKELLRRRERKQRILMLGLDHRTGRVGYVQVVVPEENREGGSK